MSYKLAVITQEKELAIIEDNSMKTSAQCTAVVKMKKCQNVLREGYDIRLEAL